MKIISFSYTTPAVLADRKHRTRRKWNDGYASRIRLDERLQGWDHLPRARVLGAKKVCEIEITAPLRKEPNSMMTDADYELEGFAYLEEQGIPIWGKPARVAFNEWRADKDAEYWVIDFQKVNQP